MALSASKDFTVTRDDIIETALKKIGVYDAGEAVPAAELTDAALALNLILKEWTVEGVGLPMREQAILILNYKTQKYALGKIGTTGTTDNFHFFAASSLYENTLSAAEAAAQTVLSVVETTWVDSEGKTKSANTSADDTLSVGVRQDDGTIHWSTQSGQSATTITLTAGLVSAAASGNKVYAYLTANRLTRPVKILYAYRSDTSRNDSQLDLVGRIEYERLSRKDSSGPPTKVHFSPTVDSWTAGESGAGLYVWPVKNPGNVDKLVLITEHYVDDFDASTNNLQLPIEWANALIWCLAAELSYEYGVERAVRQELFALARDKKMTILNAYDVENASFQMSREMSGR